MGFGDLREQPDKWREVTYLTSGLSCYAENHDELEVQLIPEQTRTSPKYSGYWFWLPLVAVGDGIELVLEGTDIEIAKGSRLYSKEPFECFGLRRDGVAARCNVSAEVLLAPRHDVQKRHLVSGWEMTHEDFTWWRSDDPSGKSDETAWLAARRVCPSHVLASCDPRFGDAIDSDRDWEALLVPSDFIGRTLVAA
jgi:hypothetical protein